MKRLVVLLGLTCGLCGQPFAQAPAQDLSVDDLEKALTPQRATTRGLRNMTVAPAKVDLVINFDFNSARIQDSSNPQLERLASAMKLEHLQALRFQVEGHTDAKGTAPYNQALSERRAQAVAHFLSGKGVGSARLAPVGKGFSELLNKDDPLSPDNRRVRISTLEQ